MRRERRTIIENDTDVNDDNYITIMIMIMIMMIINHTWLKTPK